MAQGEDVIVKCEKKDKGTTKYDKRTVTCDVGITQYEDEIVKCDVLETWYSRLPTSGYRKKKNECTVELPTFKIVISI